MCGHAWIGEDWCGIAAHGWAALGVTRFGRDTHARDSGGSTPPAWAALGEAWQGVLGSGIARLGAGWLGVALLGTVRQGEDIRTSEHGEVRPLPCGPCGMAPRGMVLRCGARRGWA